MRQHPLKEIPASSICPTSTHRLSHRCKIWETFIFVVFFGETSGPHSAGAVNTLVGDRGVRTVSHPFPLAPLRTSPDGSHQAALQDDVVTITPIVVNPNRRGPIGPLGTLKQPESTPKESGHNPTGQPPAKRAKLVAASSASAMSVAAEDAESICYGVQLCGMPGKFDNDAATKLGVPFGEAGASLNQ